MEGNLMNKSNENFKDIDDFYIHLKDVKVETYGMRFGRWCTRRWHNSRINQLKWVTKLLLIPCSKLFGTKIGNLGGGRNSVLLNENKYKKLYYILNDEKSKKTLLCILGYRITSDVNILHEESDFVFNQYFDKKIMNFSNSEVFVDCGGFVGDTVEMFINRVPIFSKIYMYEPQHNNYLKAKKYLLKWEKDVFERIVLREAGVGKECVSMKITSDGSASAVSPKGDYNINIVSLDDDIAESVSFIKMDIEGFEIDALEGAKRHISTEKPKLAICVYHKIEDLWEIPELILKLNPSYKLYLRQYNAGDNPSESVIYAI